MKQLRELFVEDVAYEDIFYRDNGTCKICGLPVPFDKHIDDNWGATIDHIVPLSKGGEHSIKNCQLAHRICNSLKSDFGKEKYSICWEHKSTENNYWKKKYSSYIDLMETV